MCLVSNSIDCSYFEKSHGLPVRVQKLYYFHSIIQFIAYENTCRCCIWQSPPIQTQLWSLSTSPGFSRYIHDKGYELGILRCHCKDQEYALNQWTTSKAVVADLHTIMRERKRERESKRYLIKDLMLQRGMQQKHTWYMGIPVKAKEILQKG